MEAAARAKVAPQLQQNFARPERTALRTAVVGEHHEVVGAVGAVPVRLLPHVSDCCAHRVCGCIARAEPQPPPKVCHLDARDVRMAASAQAPGTHRAT